MPAVSGIEYVLDKLRWMRALVPGRGVVWK